MSGTDHERVSKLFLSARRLSHSDRKVFLARACDGDETLRSEVEALLSHDTEEGGFLDLPAVGRNATEASRIPERIGAYRLLRLIGEGGMGVVYLAEQMCPRRRVALKVMKTVCASARLLKRFEHEGQTLARLQHAAIAQIFEAAVADSPSGPQPFFALEYVDGRPITEYARSQALSVRDRLALMIRVCDAVQHAHQKGVIHRDLKPANILVVDSTGAPKILDFGIARVSDPDGEQTTLLTKAGELVGTLPYMSPEQVGGDPSDVDTRSDIYALGLILYELLAGMPAHNLDRCAISEAARVIREHDPAPLGSIERSFRGDIENIVAKAIDKDRQRRYQSAGEMAGDIQRFLDDQPISARPASRLYQIRKFARRNRALVIGISIAFLALSIGSVAATWQAFRAHREARRTEKINHFLRRIFAAIDPQDFGREVRVVDVVKRAEEEIATTFGDEPLLEAVIRAEIGGVYLSLGAFAEAEPHCVAAFDIRRRHLGDFHPDTLASESQLGVLRSKQARYAEAEPLLRAANDRRKSVLGEDHPDTLATMSDLAVVLHAMGKLEEAETLCRAALPVQSRLLGPNHLQTLTTTANLASILQARGESSEAELLHHGAMNGLSERLGPTHPTTLLSAGNLARLLKDQKRYDEAEPLQRRVVEGLAERLGRQHPDTLIAQANLAMMLWRQNKLDEAEMLYRAARKDLAAVFGDEHGYLMTVTTQLALVLEQQARYGEAADLLRTALEGSRRLLGEDHTRTQQVREHLDRVLQRVSADP